MVQQIISPLVYGCVIHRFSLPDAIQGHGGRTCLNNNESVAGVCVRYVFASVSDSHARWWEFRTKGLCLEPNRLVADKPTILHWCCVSTMCGLRARDTHTMRDTKGHSGFWKSQRISWETEDEKASGTLFLFHQLDNALMCYGKRMQKCRLWKWLFQEDGYAILVLPECLFTQKVCHFLLSRGGCCEVGSWLCFVVYVMWRCVYIQSWVKRICSSSLHSPLNMIMMCHLFKKRLRSAS